MIREQEYFTYNDFHPDYHEDEKVVYRDKVGEYETIITKADTKSYRLWINGEEFLCPNDDIFMNKYGWFKSISKALKWSIQAIYG